MLSQTASVNLPEYENLNLLGRPHTGFQKSINARLSIIPSFSFPSSFKPTNCCAQKLNEKTLKK